MPKGRKADADAVPDPAADRAIPHAHPIRLRTLDGWRGLSIIVVLLGHFVGDVVLVLGHLGVEMFFVLSGRLMAQILFVERFPLREFYRRRVARILPAMTAFLVIGLVVFHHDRFMGARWRFAAASQLLVYNYVGAAGHRAPVFDHIWSLCIEEHSYILLAMLAWLVRRGRVRLRPALLLAAALSMIDGVWSEVVLRQDWYADYWRTDTHIASILLSAWVFLTLRDPGRRVPGWLSPLCAVLGAASFAKIMPAAVQLTLGTAFLALAIGSIDRAWTIVRTVLSARILTIAGVLSYSIYLWQQPFYQIAVWQLRLPPIEAALWVIPAVACGVASYVLVERPSRRWLNSLELPFPRRSP